MGLSFIFEVMTASIMTMNIDLLSFFHGYVSWVNSLTFWQFVGIISFVFVDLFRNVGKPIVLALHQLIIKVRPLQFLSIENAQIKISILIPAHNEGASIRKTIESILENTYPNKEIVIIDDHSTDDTFQQAYPYYKKGLIKLVQRSQGVGSKSGAINFGIVFATGDVVLVMDGDTLLERNALVDVAKFMTVSDMVAVAGNVRILSVTTESSIFLQSVSRMSILLHSS